MILYKYVSFNGAENIIKNSSIGFRSILDLNDPFEGSFFSFKDGDKLSGDNAKTMFRQNMAKKYALLSLTRQPHNALMWAHYGCSHDGVVVGFDANKANFTNEKTCVIPAQFGEVIYTSVKNNSIDPLASSELVEMLSSDAKFSPSSFNLLKRAFLYKSLEWAYEEEVRVVKGMALEQSRTDACENNLHDNWTKIDVNGSPLHCLNIPRESIVSVHLGYNWMAENRGSRMDSIESWKNSGIEIFRCDVDLSSWKVVSRKF